MKQIEVTVAGADDLAKHLDNIERLVHKLRLELAELKEKGLRLEMTLNQPSGSPTADSGNATE